MVKLIVLVAVIVAVFFAFKYIKRVKAQPPPPGAARGARSRDPGGRFGWARRVFKAEDMVECPRCGTFVRSIKDHACRDKA